MPTRIKVCGITRLEDARIAVELGVAGLGFNFYPPSPRHVTPERARDIIRQLPPFVVPVGVFANEQDASHVASVACAAGVTVVQLHGVEIPSLNSALRGFTIIRALQVQPGFNAADLCCEGASAYLLDTCHSTLHGGTGKTFDWSLAKEASNRKAIILAGGLTPENVGSAIREVRPYAVDVASGVEASPGIKDPVKLRAFFSAVTKTDAVCSEAFMKGEIGRELEY